MATAGTASPGGDDVSRLTDAQRALRVQILATEHWSLLASRSTTQSEVLTRIAIFLTLVSAGVFSLGVLGNATGFRGWFAGVAIGVLLLLSLLGAMTQLRVLNTAHEDLAYVLAMNRLRGAYVDLDPGVERYLVMSPADDGRTYYPFASRDRTQALASSMVLILVVESVLVGTLCGSVVRAATGSVGWAVGVGVVVAVAHCGILLLRGYRGYRAVWRVHVPLRRSA
ncbi:hypothetical protein [Cellulosimicrobium sp. CUA-896]|uniref:hypothetical protein n=1 Tax=Cellulosimicrobium sp. CUA-896 TaxID=1517881 RepID=UPI000968931A|nr:hypothetical protein [Cellulosimicrobium sp. CUA-896]OLT53556.1 hypothetical protein BJF88_11015 [Cellulosimicrobium sp. CUA-896]